MNEDVYLRECPCCGARAVANIRIMAYGTMKPLMHARVDCVNEDCKLSIQSGTYSEEYEEKALADAAERWNRRKEDTKKTSKKENNEDTMQMQLWRDDASEGASKRKAGEK